MVTMLSALVEASGGVEQELAAGFGDGGSAGPSRTVNRHAGRLDSARRPCRPLQVSVSSRWG